jgi:uncharacterized protein (UPF0335 family)
VPDVGGIAGDRLRSFIERIERPEEEKRSLATDIKEVYAEAKGTGFDTRIMRHLVKLRRMDKDDLDEQEALLDLYKRALGMLADLPLGEAAIDRVAGGVDRAARSFVDAIAREDGDSVSITGPGGKGVSIRNVRGKKIVDRVGETASP